MDEVCCTKPPPLVGSNDDDDDVGSRSRSCSGLYSMVVDADGARFDGGSAVEWRSISLKLSGSWISGGTELNTSGFLMSGIERQRKKTSGE